MKKTNDFVNDDLRTIGKFKDMIMDILFKSEDVRDLCMPQLDNDNFDVSDNFFGGKNLEYFDTDSNEIKNVDLLGHCFDVPYIDTRINDTRALITLESYIKTIEGDHIKEVELDIFIYSHKDFIHMDNSEKGKFVNKGYAGNRIDMLCAAVVDAIKDHSKDFGISGLHLNPFNPIYPYEPKNEFYGKKISYLCHDFFIKPKNQDSRG